MSEKLILEKIRSVRRRLNVQRAFQTLARFLYYGLLICMPLFVVDSFIATFDISPFILLWTVLGLSAIALIVSLLRPINLHEAARTIDLKASLKDRVVSGLEFIQCQTDEILTALQLKDTSDRLQSVTAKEVVRYSVPRETKFIALIMTVGLAFSYIEFFDSPEARATFDFSPQIAAETDHLLKQIKESEKAAEEIGLKDTLQEIKEKALELKRAGITPKKALAKLTEMTKMLSAKMNSAGIAKVDALMKELGEQFIANPNLGDFGYALKEGKYERAAERLFNLSNKLEQFNSEQRQNLADALQRGGSSVQRTEIESFGNELTKAAAALTQRDLKEAEKRLQDGGQSLLARALTKQRNRLLAQLLSQCQACKAGICKAHNGNSSNPSNNIGTGNNAGTGTDPNPFGVLTNLDSFRQLEQITGMQGAGESTVEITEVPIAGSPATSTDGRSTEDSYKEVYTKYHKLSEDALSQEQIPLGYRFYVKRYFESIKPNEK